MTAIESNNPNKTTISSNRPYGVIGLLWLLLFSAALIFVTYASRDTWLFGLVDRLFAFDTAKSTWFITRSAGFSAYLLLWFSTAWGLAVSSKFLDRLLHRTITFEFHQFISLLAVGFMALHILILCADRYMPFSLAEILVPFLAPYKQFWVGIGVIGMYLILLVTVTYYLRQKIGMRAFRAIHILSLAAYLGATLHGIFSGTDSALPLAILMYFSTFLVVVFLTTYWLLMRLWKEPA